MTNYLMLMRHAKHEVDPNDRAGGRKLSTDGENETKDVIEKLADMRREFKNDMDLSFNIKEIWRADTPEVIKTTEVVHTILKEPLIKNVIDLNPAYFNPYKNTKTHSHVAELLGKWASGPKENKAVLVIGHQPFLSWLAHEFTGEAIPLSHSEVACLAFDQAGKKPRGRLRWVLTPSIDAAKKKLEEDLKELKEKIKSKMEIAKLLGVAITTVLAFLLGYLVDETKVAGLRNYWGAELALRLSTVAFLIATALYLATMYAYDRLLMPTRFWGEARPPGDPDERPKWLVWRPPSSALWVLYQNMMRVWRYLFTSATYSVFVGLLLLAYAVFHPNRWWTISLFLVGSVVGVILFRFGYHHFGPRLGTED